MREGIVQYDQGTDPPDQHYLRCERCLRDKGYKATPHDRVRISLPAKDLSDRPMSPMVAGGNFDTVGKKAVPQLPEFKGETGSDFKDFVNHKDYKATKKERQARLNENKAKAERARMIKAGANISIRHNPLPGDPSFT
jgi:hypothetical protein